MNSIQKKNSIETTFDFVFGAEIVLRCPLITRVCFFAWFISLFFLILLLNLLSRLLLRAALYVGDSSVFYAQFSGTYLFFSPSLAHFHNFRCLCFAPTHFHEEHQNRHTDKFKSSLLMNTHNSREHTSITLVDCVLVIIFFGNFLSCFFFVWNHVISSA